MGLRSNWQPRGATIFTRPQTFTADEFDLAMQSGIRCAPHSPRRALRAPTPRIVLAVDPAAGTKERNDYSAAAVIALDGAGARTRGWLLHVYRARLELPALVAQVRDLQQRWGASVVACESVAGFKGLPQTLRALDGAGGLPVLEVQPKGDKAFRAQPLAAAILDGRFRVPEERNAPWLRPFLDELLSFPVGPHDDQVDACTLAFNLLALEPTPDPHAPRYPHVVPASWYGFPFG